MVPIWTRVSITSLSSWSSMGCATTLMDRLMNTLSYLDNYSAWPRLKLNTKIGLPTTITTTTNHHHTNS